MMRAKAFNPQVFLEILCYCFLGGLMLYLVRSGRYLSYVTPRMKPYLYFMAIVMLLWVCVSLFRLFRPQYRVRSAHCFILVIPIMLLLLPHKTLSASDISANYMGGNTFSMQQQPSSQNTMEAVEDILPTDSIGEDNINMQMDASDEIPWVDLPGLDEAKKKITVSNDDFGIWMMEIYMHMEKYQGYSIEMTGSVFKDSEFFKEDEFVPGRQMMSCCIADLSIAGILCRYEGASQLEQDAWVTVEGILSIGQYEYDGYQYDEPQIQVSRIVPAEPVEGFVYPF
ncbi:MAG: TIGR03943 family protein [Peptostreptococcales bacterium]|jgi:putative membrane protein